MIQFSFEHVYISLAGSLLGILAGLAVGLALQNWFHRISNSRLAPFVPWRTLAVGLILVNFYPIIPVFSFGNGNISGILSVSYAIFLLTIVILFQLSREHSDKPLAQLIPWLHTLVVFSVILTIHYGSWGGGGLGFYAYQKIVLLEYGAVLRVFALICLIAFLFDELFGLARWLIDSRSRGASSRSTGRQKT